MSISTLSKILLGVTGILATATVVSSVKDKKEIAADDEAVEETEFESED